MKKVNITTFGLLAYLLIMGIIGWPGREKAQLSYTEYFAMMGVTLLVIFLLRFLHIKRSKMRDKWKKGDE